MRIIGKNEDRDGDIIDISGVDIEGFKANPIVFADFNHEKPIGKAINIVTKKDGIYCEFDLLKEYIDKVGSNNLTRCGYRIIQKDGNVITKCELIEVSIII